MMRFIVFFIAALAIGNVAGAQNWKAFIEGGGIPDREAPFCSAVQNGILQLPQSGIGDYWTKFRLEDTIFVDNNFVLEVRLRNSSATGGISAFDTGIYLDGCSIRTGATIMGDPAAQIFTDMFAGTSGVSGEAALVRDLSNWHIIRYIYRNNIFYLFYDNTLAYTVPYTGDLTYIRQLLIRFKGAGQVDWIKLYNAAGQQIWTEEFTTCATLTALPASSWQSDFALQVNKDTTVCKGESVLFSAKSSANLNYQWSGPNGFNNNQSNFLLNNVAPKDTGWYAVTGNYKGCLTLKDSVHLRLTPTVSPSTQFLGRDTTLCLNTALRLGRGYPCASYRWQDGSTDSIFTVRNPGRYAVQIQIDNQSFSDTINVAYYPLPQIELGRDTILCPGDTLRLNAFLSTAATYRWQDGSNQSFFKVQQAGLYNVTINDICNNTTKDSIYVDYYKILKTLNLGRDTTICPGTAITLNVMDSAAISYRWQDGSNKSNFTVNAPGIYQVTLRDNCGNVKTDSIQIKVFELVQSVNIGKDTTLCSGETLLLKATNRAAKFYRWQDGSQDSTFLVSKPGIYTVQVTDNCGNTVSDALEVKYFPVLKPLDLGKDTSLCPGTSILLNAADPAAILYTWQDKSDQPKYEVTKPGTYLVTLLDNCNNALIDSIQIAYYQLIDSINIGPRDTVLCVGTTLTLDASSPASKSYTWQDGQRAATYNVSQPGIYQIQVNDNCGNSASDEIRIRYTDVPKPTFLSGDTIVCEGEVFRLNATASDANSYRWQDGFLESIYPVTKPGYYTVSVGNACGNALYSLAVGMEYCGPCRSYAPTAFSPNGDGNNDKFIIATECVFTHYDFRVFNRWGSQVFRTNAPWLGWDGMVNGSELPNGVYVWQMRYIAEDGTSNTLTGDVLLMR